MYNCCPDSGGLLELVKDEDLLLLSDLLTNGGGSNKDSTNKVGECLNAPLGKEIELIDGRGQIQGVQISNQIGKDTGNTDELEDEFALYNEEKDSSEDVDEDDVEPTIHDEVEEDENIDLSGNEDGYESDVHEELNIVKTYLKHI
ncbi:hypothetical protein HAX54_049906 [Datura stramonium]|uniref:Uncharacterized protein n=1 Tax=Datura stramonium TaxID=4076 RepID=A0ABS8SXI1_DATST|nr:hypothetical protein [Datura stramonium]